MGTRREFLQSAAMAAVVASMPQWALGRAKRLPIGFSTLGCPAWDWNKILGFATANGFAAIELRGLEANMDLPSLPAFSADQIAAKKKDVVERGLKIACVSSSATMHYADPDKRAKELDDGRKFIDLAAALGAPYVRVFGNKIEGPKEETLKRVASALKELGDYAGPKNVMVLLESHGDFTDSPTLLEVLQRAESPHVALLWDAHHTFTMGHEDPAFTVAKLGRLIAHTHLKDSVPDGKDRKYVLTGEGDVPVKKQVEALANNGYRGYYTFEWEKVWHPELAEPEVAFPQYAKVMTQYLAEAGVGKKSRR